MLGAFGLSDHCAYAYSSKVERGDIRQEASLGQGFDSRGRKLMEQCFEEITRFQPHPHGVLDTVYQFQSGQEFNRFVLSVSAGVGYFGIGAWVTASGDKSSSSSYLQKTFRSRFEMTTPTEVLPEVKLTSLGEFAFNTRDPQIIAMVCGDEIVTRIDRGAELNLLMRLSAEKGESHTLASLALEIGLGFLSFTQQLLSLETRDFSDQASLEVNALQVGGTGETLNALLREKPAACRFDDRNCLRDLDAFMRELLMYQSDSDGKESGFSKDFNESKKRKDGRSLVSFETTPISHFFPDFPQSHAEKQAISQKDFLKAVRSEQIKAEADLDTLYWLEKEGVPHSREKLLLRKLRINLLVLDSLWSDCHYLSKRCFEDYESKLEPYDI